MVLFRVMEVLTGREGHERQDEKMELIIVVLVASDRPRLSWHAFPVPWPVS
jgi:hypothetical protein